MRNNGIGDWYNGIGDGDITEPAEVDWGDGDFSYGNCEGNGLGAGNNAYTGNGLEYLPLSALFVPNNTTIVSAILAANIFNQP